MSCLRNILVFISLVMVTAASAAAETSTLDLVKQRKLLKCGVSQGLAGFSVPDAKGRWSGLDTDFCRAVAVAVLGDASKVQFIPLSAKERFTALQSGEVDLLSRNTTWTMSRDTAVGINFVGVIYHDGQAFMVRKDLKVTSAKQLDGAIVCTNSGTTTELNIADFFRKNNLLYEVISFEHSDETVRAYESGRCDVYSTDASGLAAQRSQLADPNAHIILPEIISKEPLAPAVRQGDDQWANIVRWTLFALINAEELELTKKNINKAYLSDDPNVLRFVGAEGDLGTKLALDKHWAQKVIAELGNYGEIYERNLGAGSTLNIPRGHNALWSKGGVLTAPPIR